MGVGTYVLLPRAATLRLSRQPQAVIDEHGVLQLDDRDLRDPALVDGDVRSILHRWTPVGTVDEAYCLRLQLGDSVADDPGDPRGVYLFPDTVVAVGHAYAEALQWLEARGCGRWAVPMTAEEAERYRPATRSTAKAARGQR